MNRFGYSSRLGYDKDCSYEDRLAESTGPLQYIMDTNRINNCDACLSTLGPRSGFMGFGVSMPVENQPAVAQQGDIVNIESLLSNRNVKKSKCRRDGANPVDVTKFPLKHPRICNDYLSPLSSKLSYPSQNYRDCSVNRFYNLNKDPQNYGNNIYVPVAIDTKLEAIDNFYGEIPQSFDVNPSLPHALEGKPTPRVVKVTNSTARRQQ